MRICAVCLHAQVERAKHAMREAAAQHSEQAAASAGDLQRLETRVTSLRSDLAAAAEQLAGVRLERTALSNELSGTQAALTTAEHALQVSI